GELLSDEMRLFVRSWAEEKYGEDFILKDPALESHFEINGISYQSRPERKAYFPLYEQFKPSHFIDSTIYDAGDYVVTHLSLIDFWTAEPVQQHLIYMSKQNLKSYTWSAWFREQLYQLIPNSLGIGYIDSQNSAIIFDGSNGQDRFTLETTGFAQGT